MTTETTFGPNAIGALFNLLPIGVVRNLHQRGLSDTEIEQLTPKEAFEHFCDWNGLINWSNLLWSTVASLMAIEARIKGEMQYPHPNLDTLVQVVIFASEGMIRSVAVRPLPSRADACVVVDYDDRNRENKEQFETIEDFEVNRLGCTRDDFDKTRPTYIW